MKKIFFIIVFISASIIAWCWDKINFEFSFENFYWYFFTENTFEKSEKTSTWLWFQLIKTDIIQTYAQSNSTWYVDSIIIIKKITDKKLEDFVEENIKKIKLEWYKSDSTKDWNIRCKEDKIKINIINSQLSANLNTIFFTHAFFKVENNMYIISFSTDKKEERDTFASDVKNIKCK